MIILKLLGAGAVAASSFLFIRELNRRETRILSALDGYISLIRYIKVQIECYGASISDIFARMDRQRLADCGADDSAISTVTDFRSLLDKTKVDFPESVQALLEGFCSELGKSYRDAQLACCDYYERLLSDERTAISAAFPNERGVRGALILSAAGAVVILLL